MATIFTPQNPTPRNEVRDMLLNQSFSVTVDGVRVTDYQIRIYKVSDNSLVHDTTKLNLGTPLSDGQLLTHTLTGGTIANTGTDSYKWTIQVWNGAETVTTREFQFFAKTTPVLTFTPPAIVTSQSYEFTGTITQVEGDIVNFYTMELYDSNMEFIESSGQITSFNIAHEFEGFVSGDDLYVRVFGQTTGRQSFDSGLVNFSVSYAEPSVNLKPDVVVDNYTSLVEISRGEVVQIIGTSFGDISYTNSFLYTGNNALVIEDNLSYVDFEADVPVNFTLSVKWKPLSNEFTGKILELDNGMYEVGYDGVKFYIIIDGETSHTDDVSIYGSVFYLVLLPQGLVYVKTQLFTQLQDFVGTTLNDLVGTTLDEISVFQ